MPFHNLKIPPSSWSSSSTFTSPTLVSAFVLLPLASKNSCCSLAKRFTAPGTKVLHWEHKKGKSGWQEAVDVAQEPKTGWEQSSQEIVEEESPRAEQSICCGMQMVYFSVVENVWLRWAIKKKRIMQQIGENDAILMTAQMQIKNVKFIKRNMIIRM